MRRFLYGILFLFGALSAKGQCTVDIFFTESPVGEFVFLGLPNDSTFLTEPLNFSWTVDAQPVSQEEIPLIIFNSQGVFDVCAEIEGADGNICFGCITVVVGGGANFEMRPGDANNNGQVSILDVLFHGLAFGELGIPRINPSSLFEEEQFFQPWNQNFPNGINYGQADGNGDGVINDVDLFVIASNYGKSVDGALIDTFEIGVLEQDVPIGFDLSNTDIPEDSIELSIPIFLGNQLQPLQDFHGLAFSILFDTVHVDPSSFSIDLIDGWVNSNGQDDVLSFFAVDTSQPGKLDVAISRKNLAGVNGFGPFASLSIILEENVWDLAVSTDLEITNIKIITPQLEESTAFPYGLTLDFLLSSVSAVQDDRVQIFPNPFQDRFNLRVEGRIQNARVFDVQGRLVWSQTLLNSGDHQIQIPGRQSGLFILQYERNGQLYHQKLISNP